MKSYTLWEILAKHHVGRSQKARVAPFLKPALLSNGRYSLAKANILMLDAIADLKKTSKRPGIIGQPRGSTTRTSHEESTKLRTSILPMSNRIQRIEEKLDKLLEIWS